MKQSTVRYIISIVAIVLIVLRLLFPTYQFDNLILILIIVAILPWLSAVFKSIEFPTGHKIELQEFKAAGEKISSIVDDSKESLIKEAKSDQFLPNSSFSSVIPHDPNLAVVGLRIEIEKRLKALGSHFGINEQRNISAITNQLAEKGVIDRNTSSGLLDLIRFGNQAAHGAKIDSSVTDWIFSSGRQVIKNLDLLIAKNYEINVGEAIAKAIIILNYEGPKVIEVAISILRLIQSDGYVNLKPNDTMKSDVGIILLKLGAIRPREENETKVWEKKHVMTPLGVALYSYLLHQ